MTPDNDTPSPNWTPIDTAARLTGKSGRTLRRWVASGKLASERRSGRLYVDLASDVLTSPGDDIAPPVDSDYDTSRQEVDKLTAELATVMALLEEIRGERDYLRQLHLMSQARLIEADNRRSARRRWWWPWSTED